ncbi:unnamed protein product, partial [marine sediment metagenome]
NDYQTVYAVYDGSIAAPTAGLHFTKSLLKELAQKGIEIIYLTLHVGRGTFEPIRASKVEEHKMDSEFYSISSEVAKKINQARTEKRRVISVGTTTTRSLESAFNSSFVFLFFPHHDNTVMLHAIRCTLHASFAIRYFFYNNFP